jgi:hypothetical protein
MEPLQLAYPLARVGSRRRNRCKPVDVDQHDVFGNRLAIVQPEPFGCFAHAISMRRRIGAKSENPFPHGLALHPAGPVSIADGFR